MTLMKYAKLMTRIFVIMIKCNIKDYYWLENYCLRMSDSCLVDNLSAIIPRTCSNLVCRSSVDACAPLLPHRNLI